MHCRVSDRQRRVIYYKIKLEGDHLRTLKIRAVQDWTYIHAVKKNETQRNGMGLAVIGNIRFTYWFDKYLPIDSNNSNNINMSNDRLSRLAAETVY